MIGIVRTVYAPEDQFPAGFLLEEGPIEDRTIWQSADHRLFIDLGLQGAVLLFSFRASFDTMCVVDILEKK